MFRVRRVVRAAGRFEALGAVSTSEEKGSQEKRPRLPLPASGRGDLKECAGFHRDLGPLPAGLCGGRS